MKPEIHLKHHFVEFIPEELEEGRLYVSIRFATVSHLCVCGCKNKVVTPLKPTDWKLIFDGKTVSLHPSIGNWSFPCRSHYWVQNNKARWAADWSQAQIDAGREYDRRAKERYFRGVDGMDEPTVTPPKADPPTAPPAKLSWWNKLWPW